MDFSVNSIRMFSLQFAALGEEKEPNMVYIKVNLIYNSGTKDCIQEMCWVFQNIEIAESCFPALMSL